MGVGIEDVPTVRHVYPANMPASETRTTDALIHHTVAARPLDLAGHQYEVPPR